jgi:hypothetical protein
LDTKEREGEMDVIKRLPIILFVACAAFGPYRSAQAAETFYVGVQLPYNVIQGDFDNTHLPEVSPGFGLGVSFGYQLMPRVAVDVNWSVSKMKTVGVTVDFQERSLNGRYLLSEDKSMQPYVLLGYGQFSFGDPSLTFGGRGVRFGVGFDSFLGPKLSLGAALVRSVPSYDRIEKSDGPVTLVGSLRGDTTSLILNMKYHF